MHVVPAGHLTFEYTSQYYPHDSKCNVHLALADPPTFDMPGWYHPCDQIFQHECDTSWTSYPSTTSVIRYNNVPPCLYLF